MLAQKKRYTRREILKRKFDLKDVPYKGKKFIIIQIDALGYGLFKNLKTHTMPFLKKFVKENNITQWDPGIPTNTHYVQAGIMYGDNAIIPGYRFFDKKEQKGHYLGTINTLVEIENQLENYGKGILRGGTSIGLNFSGGAARSVFTQSKIYAEASKVKTFRDAFYIAVVSPLATLRTFFYSTWEILAEIFDMSYSFVRYQKFKGPLTFPIRKMFLNSLLAELSTEAALLEIDRRSPYIYINYVGYDVTSHNRGPKSLSALGVLRQIDAYVKKLVKKATKEDYDIYIISDHGQVQAIPFSTKFGEHFEDIVEKFAKTSTRVLETDESTNSYIGKKLKYYYRQLSYPLRILAWFPMVFATLRGKPKITEVKPIMLMYSSCLAQMYLTEFKKRLDISKIEKVYPRLIEAIVNHEGIGIVLAKEGKNIHILHKKGKIIIKDKTVQKEGKPFLHVYGNEKKLIEQIRMFMKQKHNGDLVINGEFDGKKIVAFEDYHFGAHDGIGGAQHDAFFVSEQKMDLSKVIHAKELHDIFESYHN